MRQPSSRAVAEAEAIFTQSGGVMRTKEALKAGIHPRTLYWMKDQAKLEALSRGVFHLTSMPYPTNPDVAAVMRRVPKATLCLLSALSFHQIGTQIPNEVQIALPRNIRAPKISYPTVNVFSMNDSSLNSGIEDVKVGNTQFQVFGIAKTVADCFKFRNKIGLDVAIEALQEVIQKKLATPGEILKYAQLMRVESVVESYLRALL